MAKAASSVMSGIGKGVSSLARGIGNVVTGMTPSSVGGMVDFVNTPATLSNAVSGAMNAGNWLPGGISSLAGSALGNLISPAQVGGGSYSDYVNGTTPLPEPQTIMPPVDFQTPATPDLVNTSAGIGSGIGALSGLLGVGQPQTIGGPQAQQPLVNGQVPLVNTPGSIVPPGSTVTPPGQGFQWQDFLKSATQLGLLGGQLGGDNGLGPEADKLRALANDVGGRGKNLLETSIANQQGQISAPALNAIDRRLEESKAQIRKNYAGMGMSGSTMESQDLAAADQDAADTTFRTGQSMAITGLQTAAQMLGQESNIYTLLMNAQIQKDQELGRVLSEFAAASAK